MKVGDIVSIRGTVSYYGAAVEFEYYYNDIEFKNDIKEPISFAEAREQLNSRVTVRGYVASYLTNTTFLLIDESNSDSIIVYMPISGYNSVRPKVGDRVEISGYSMLYGGNNQIANPNSITTLKTDSIESSCASKFSSC